MYVVNVYHLQIHFLFSYTLLHCHKTPEHFFGFQEWIFVSFDIVQ